ncbi:MAG: sorbosone dehydrogenase family protein, partial [Nitrosomonas sp.]
MKSQWQFLFLFVIQTVTFQIQAQTSPLPLEKIKLPPGFTIGIWAIVPDARSMTLGDKGTVFVGSRSAGNIYAITQNNGERQVRIIANRLKEPTGVAF